MVLSKKKLKQKLRDKLTLNQIEALSNPNSNTPSSSSSISLKLLLNSESRKPILSKREKLRKLRPLQQNPKPLPSKPTNEDEGTKNNEIENEGNEKKYKKRKRKVENKNNDYVTNGVVVQPPNDEGIKNNEIGTEGFEEKKKNKKKKSKVEKKKNDDGVASEVVVVKKGINKLKKNKLKQKKKRLQKKKKKAKIAEENGSSNQVEQITQSTELININATTITTISQENGDVATKVYVGGIPYYSTEDDIRSYFEGCGTIIEIHCITFPDTGKFRGIAIISFKTEAAAKRALAFDGADMGGLFLKIQPYKATQATRFAPEMKEGYNRIYVGSLSWEITEEELRKFFTNCNIKSIRLGKDKETGEFRGYAHVDFSDSQSLKTALALDQSVLFGRPVRISCAVPLKKKTDEGEKSVADKKPSAAIKSVAGEKPSASKESVAGSKPGAVEKSVAVEKPGAVEKSVEVVKPGAVEKPDAGEEPVVKPSSVVSGGKRKNRMCYGCRQKGHNLSECPNQQTVASTTS